MSHLKDNYTRTDSLKDWHESGGVMIIGYDMYRNLSTHKNVRKKKLKTILTETLVDPGNICEMFYHLSSVHLKEFCYRFI